MGRAAQSDMAGSQKVANSQKGQKKEKFYAEILTFRLFSKNDAILPPLKTIGYENGRFISNIRFGT